MSLQLSGDLQIWPSERGNAARSHCHRHPRLSEKLQMNDRSHWRRQYLGKRKLPRSCAAKCRGVAKLRATSNFKERSISKACDLKAKDIDLNRSEEELYVNSSQTNTARSVVKGGMRHLISALPKRYLFQMS